MQGDGPALSAGVGSQVALKYFEGDLSLYLSGGQYENQRHHYLLECLAQRQADNTRSYNQHRIHVGGRSHVRSLGPHATRTGIHKTLKSDDGVGSSDTSAADKMRGYGGMGWTRYYSSPSASAVGCVDATAPSRPQPSSTLLLLKCTCLICRVPVNYTMSHEALNPIHPSVLAHLDPEFVSLYNKHVANTPAGPIDLSVLRSKYSVLYSYGTGPAPDCAHIYDTTVPGHKGELIPVRVYEPASPGPWPVHVDFHGGGTYVPSSD